MQRFRDSEAGSKTLGIIFIIALIIGSIMLGYAVVRSPDAGAAIVVNFFVVLICVWFITRVKDDNRFLLRIFIAALCVRYTLAIGIFLADQQTFFGPDAETYDAFGYALYQSWIGEVDPTAYWLVRYTSITSSGWGMYYFVGGLYSIMGRNPLAMQLMCAAIGSITCVVVYKICHLVYPEQRVARVAAMLIAFSPSMIIWSSQFLRDAPIVLFLCLCTYYALKLRERIDVFNLLMLFLSLLGLYSLRHYAAYILFAAIAGSLILAAREITPWRVVQGGLLVLIIGFAFTYFGASEVLTTKLDLQFIQSGREWSARVSESGFGGDVDITDAKAAISFLPIGMLYVLFAPFPWMITNLRQLITLPELLAWWALTPIMIWGLWHAMKKRLRESFVIVIFTVGLVLVYALYQSNVGTAYRHRSQLYVFFVVFISIGLDLRRTARVKKRAQQSFEPVALRGPMSTQIPNTNVSLK